MKMHWPFCNYRYKPDSTGSQEYKDFKKLIWVGFYDLTHKEDEIPVWICPWYQGKLGQKGTVA
jgi:hypothetical protein